jgi:23S rRNA (uracil1939-C5)-methyltransferase
MAEIIRNLEITSLVHGGRGIGRHEGKAVFVPLVAPGDLIDCRVVKSKKRFAEAELIEILVPSPLRREPPCPFFGACGGCQWQHLPYPEQLRWKGQNFSDQLVRSKRVQADRIKPIVAAPEEWRYRNRVQLKTHFFDDGLAIGFYRHGSHNVVDIDHCRLVAPPIQKVLSLLREDLQEVENSESVEQIDLACGDDGTVRLLLHIHPEGYESLRGWLQTFAASYQLNACIKSVGQGSVEIVHGEGELTVSIDQPALALRYGPGGFVQVNSSQNRAMVSNMLELLDLKGHEKILDLFCGMGNFSLPLARRAGHVVGIEDYAPSIDMARLNAEANQVKNVEFFAADASAIMDRFKGENLDLVVLDPPRTGNYDLVNQLLPLKPKRILYVSCDPATLARDLVPLVSGGYEVISSQAFDLFPQTWHIESMTLLKLGRVKLLESRFDS